MTLDLRHTRRVNPPYRFPDLDVSAVAQRRNGRDRQLVLWYLLRDRAAGTGRVSREQVWDTACWLGWDPKATDRALKLGEGIFWNRAPRRFLYLRAPEKIAYALGVRQLRATFRAPAGVLRGSLAEVRARMAIQSIAAIRHGAPIANETMADMLRVSVRTVHLWKKLSRVPSRKNFLRIAPLRPGQAAAEFRSWDLSLRTVCYGGRRYLARQLPNSYQPPAVGGRLRLRRLNRCLRPADAASSASAGGATRRRMYATGHDRRDPATALPTSNLKNPILPSHPRGPAAPVDGPSPAHPLALLGGGRWSGVPVRVWGVSAEVRGCKYWIDRVTRCRKRRMDPAARRALHLLRVARQVFQRQALARAG